MYEHHFRKADKRKGNFILVYYEKHSTKKMAMRREREIKKFGRKKKEALMDSESNCCDNDK